MRLARRNIAASFVMAVVMAGAAAWLPVGDSAARGVPGTARLIAFEPTPEAAAEDCEWEVATLQQSDYAGAGAAGAAFQSQAGSAGAASTAAQVAARKPLRFIQDPYAGFSNVKVDLARNEVVLLDANRFNIMVYDRLTNTPRTATHSEPKRIIGGDKTRSQYASDAYVDPQSGDIYAVNIDSLVGMNVFSRQAQGDVAPDRSVTSPYGAYGMAVNEATQDMYFTIRRNGPIVTWPKGA